MMILNVNDPPLIDVRLMAIRYAARDIYTFEFARLDNLSCRQFRQARTSTCICLMVWSGNIQYLRRAIRLACYALTIKREAVSRGGSHYIFDQLKPGALLKISEPVNRFRLHEDARHSVLIAGGIGITPIWAMVQELRASKRSWELHYACRTRSDMAFLELLQQLPNVNLYFSG